ncbi:hypothetical protein BAE44_0003026 [Dichanthelium oligosanthes]|uniref:Uncharacterized protein n=1 Tax=Dichanthelium oligosanthes TaxID=888268 RepID=A0A1E5WF43_9POAL|nr:hypothetical protein BAE44_0003026 [Dichanthelium oligosanthes]
MAEHHLPPEPAGHHQHKSGVHADDLKHGSRGRRYNYNYYYGGGGGGGGRALCFAILILLLAAGITWLVLYVVYRPSHPTLTVTSAAVLALYNATNAAAVPGYAPTALAASFQFTLVLRNPSGRSAARYDRLAAYVAYRGEPVTAPTPMPPLAQDAGTAVEVAPVLGGGVAAPVPVSPDTAMALAADVAYGVLALRVVVLGRVRFVSGPFHRGWHSMYARCDLLVGVRKEGNGGGAGAGGVPQQAPLLGDPVCNVDM